MGTYWLLLVQCIAAAVCTVHYVFCCLVQFFLEPPACHVMKSFVRELARELCYNNATHRSSSSSSCIILGAIANTTRTANFTEKTENICQLGQNRIKPESGLRLLFLCYVHVSGAEILLLRLHCCGKILKNVSFFNLTTIIGGLFSQILNSSHFVLIGQSLPHSTADFYPNSPSLTEFFKSWLGCWRW